MIDHTHAPLPDDDGADMGVGTMIVFIAMVLVAGVAAGVLINVANDLQQQAQDTAQQAVDQVSTGLKIISVWGDRGTSDNETVTYLSIEVSLQAGSKDIAINDLIIQVTDYATSAELNFLADTTNMTNWDAHNETKSTYLRNKASATQYTAEELRDPQDTFYQTGTDSDNPDLVIGQGALIRIFIDANAAGVSLSPSDDLEITLSATSGNPTMERVTLPDSFTDRLMALS